MRRLILAIVFAFAAAPLCAQQAAVIKAIDSSTGGTTDVGNATDHAIRVTQASGGTVWTFNWTQLLGAAPSATNPMPSRLTDGTTYIDPRSIRALTSADVVTAVGTFWQATQPVSGPATDAQLRATPLPVSFTNQSVNLNQVGGASFALGQQLAAASLPIVLTAAQLSTLTPPAAITNYANETGGNLAAIKTDVDKIPAQGQALAGASLPVVLPAAQIATLTPPAAITGYALEAGHLAAIDTSTAKIPAQGQAAMAASTPVVIANNQSAVPVSGPITDTQIRASALPVSLASAPTTPVTNAGLSNLDVLLSTRTKPADQQHVIIDTIPTTAVTLATAPTTPVTNAGLTNLDLTLSALRDAITAASPNNKTLNDLYTQLATLAAANVTPGASAPTVDGVVAGIDPLGFTRPIATAVNGVVLMAPATGPGLPLPLCNPVRRTGCQSKGF